MDKSKLDYVFKFLSCGKFAGTDVAKGSGVPQSVVYWYMRKPERIYNAKATVLDKLYLYFRSFGFNVDKLENVSRETIYKQEY